MKKDEIRAELLGLCEREHEGFMVGWYLGGEEDGGGLAPTWLQYGCHGNLLPVRLNGYRIQQVKRCFTAQYWVMRLTPARSGRLQAGEQLPAPPLSVTIDPEEDGRGHE
jgi:hypothetical protein